MMKKILSASLLLTSLTVAHANPAPYVGAGIGITSNTSNQTLPSSAGYYRGVPFNVFVGYGGILSETFYIGGELDSTLWNATINESGHMKSTYGIGLSILPGVMLNETTLGFVRLGVVKTKFSELNSWKTGAEFGAGMQTNVTQNIDVRGEYDYYAYKAATFNGSSLAPRVDSFTIDLIYIFD